MDLWMQDLLCGFPQACHEEIALQNDLMQSSKEIAHPQNIIRASLKVALTSS